MAWFCRDEENTQNGGNVQPRSCLYWVITVNYCCVEKQFNSVIIKQYPTRSRPYLRAYSPITRPTQPYPRNRHITNRHNLATNILTCSVNDLRYTCTWPLWLENWDLKKGANLFPHLMALQWIKDTRCVKLWSDQITKFDLCLRLNCERYHSSQIWLTEALNAKVLAVCWSCMIWTFLKRW